MKVIGRIEPEFIKDTDGYDIVGNSEYIEGYVVQLTKAEAHTLRMLQEAVAGYSWNTVAGSGGALGRPKSGGLEKAFMLVCEFANTRFFINQFKEMVHHLEGLMGRIEDVPDDL